MKRRLFSLITDCLDANAVGRVSARLAGLTSIVPLNPIGVRHDLEAGLCLVDQLDAIGSAPGIILVNVAPRNGDAKRWKNGTPFGWLKFKDIFVFGTVGGHSFSLLQKILGERLAVNQFDLKEAAEHFGYSEEQTASIVSSQFRSFEFLPKAAAMIVNGQSLPTTETRGIPEAPQAVVWIDCFGNVKTSVLPEEIGFKAGKQAELKTDTATYWFQCYNCLKDIPDNESGLVFGSSGLWVDGVNRRFLEIMVQGGRAVDRFKLKSGEKIALNTH